MSDESPDQMWNHLFGKPLPLAQAEQLLDQMQQQALVEEAEEAAHGVRHLTVVHGDLETDDDAQRVRRLYAAGGRATISMSATNDTTTWRLAGPEAEQALAEIEALAYQLNPGWWRIRRAAR